MRTLFVTLQRATLSILLGVAMSAVATAAPKKTTALEEKSLPSTQLSTDIHFDALTVHGRHQTPFGVTSEVEAEKETPTLIDYRNDFADRMDRTRQGR